MKALMVERNVARFAAARAASRAWSAAAVSAGIGPLRLVETEPPEIPGPGWQRVRPRLAGICGSDLSTLDGRSSRYFEELVSFPFVPGHEVVGDLEGGGRVVIQPALGCQARDVVPMCEACAHGQVGRCERVAFGQLEPGLQTGYCASTGGGWSMELVAHESQLVAVPDDLDDTAAVMVEPVACGAHAALMAGAEPGSSVVVLGGGTLGLCTIAALAQLSPPGRLLASARYEHQRLLASELGADETTRPGEVARAVRRRSRSFAVGAQLTGGADVVVDCVGNEASLSEALCVVRPGGRVVAVGMPGRVRVDLAPLWHREVQLVGAYAYGRERPPAGTDPAGVSTFSLAIDLVRSARLGRLVSACYPLERFEEAVAHAAHAGPRGAVKVVFEPGAATPPPNPRPRRWLP